MDNEKESKSETNSNITPKANYVISDKFPAGLRVLVVDDDTTCLSGLQKMLKILLYEVTTCSSPEDALSMLHECKTGFDIVISDVHLPDMTGFKLLEHVALEMDLPVIMMSVDDKKEVVMKGITHGACDYLIKPVRIEALKTIWQHVVRKRKYEIKELEQTGSVGDNDRLRKPLEDADCSSSVSEGSWKRKKDDEDEGEDKDDTSTLKKPRVVWSVELHQQFVAAVNQLGIDKAVPKKILELMNIPGLTRENVASHLQKYRLYLRRLTGVQQHQNGHSTPFMSSQEANYGSMSTLNGIDFQALAISGQFFSQSAATLQVGGLGRTTMNTGIGMSPVDQRNLLNSDTLKLRFGAGQQLNNSYKHLNVVYGLPTTLEPGDMQVREGAAGFINIPPSSLRTSSTLSHEYSVHGNQSGSLMMQMAESRSRGQFEQASGLPLPTGQQIFPNETGAPVLRRNGTIINGRGAASNPIIQATPVSAYDPVSQSASVADFPMNHITELPGNSFPLENPSGLSSLISTGMFQGGGNFEVKGLRCFPPSYGIFNELHQGKTQDWELQNVDLTFEASQHVTSVQERLDLVRPPLSHQDSACSQNNGQNKNTLASFREGNEHKNSESIAQYNNNLLVDNSLQKKARSPRNLGHDMELLGESLDQDELMSTLFKQQQEGVGNEFNFDGYTMDNIPV